MLQTFALAGAAAGLFAVWHFGALTGGNRLVVALHTAAHFPVFGAIGAIVFALLRLHGPAPVRTGARTYVTALGLMVLLSLLAEGMQALSETRHGSWRDVGVNLLGTAAALALIAQYEWRSNRRMRSLLHGVIASCTAIVFLPIMILGAAYATRAVEYPVITRFASPLDLLHIEAPGARIGRRPLPEPWREAGDLAALRVELHSGHYPGITVRDPPRNWQGHAHLELDITNPEPRPLRLTLRINDRAHDGRHDDRLNYRIELPGRTRTRYRIPYETIENAPHDRPMALDEITMLLLFGGTEQHGRTFYLSEIRLR